MLVSIGQLLQIPGSSTHSLLGAESENLNSSEADFVKSPAPLNICPPLVYCAFDHIFSI